MWILSWGFDGSAGIGVSVKCGDVVAWGDLMARPGCDGSVRL
jgi:hypothetical protein